MGPWTTPGIDHFLQERWIAEQHGLLELRRQALHNAQDLVDLVTGCSGDDRITLRREMPHARAGEHAADPGAEREADDGQRALFMRAESVAEYLLEAHRDRELVGLGARPEGRLSRGAR
jgi:hypothetical protein